VGGELKIVAAILEQSVIVKIHTQPAPQSPTHRYERVLLSPHG
jgi:hypothetical protein